MINQLTIIGVGLIGSSLSLSLKKSGYVNHVIGCGRNEANLKLGLDLGVLDRYSLSIAEAIQGSDVVVVAVPLGAMQSVFKAISTSLNPGTIITDVGSAKATVVADAKAIFGDNYPKFVAGHPIAGSENSGVEAGVVDLYQDRKVILTPEENTDVEAIATIEKMWLQTGASIEFMGIEHHDKVLAATSHLPHMLAFSLVTRMKSLIMLQVGFEISHALLRVIRLCGVMSALRMERRC